MPKSADWNSTNKGINGCSHQTEQNNSKPRSGRAVSLNNYKSKKQQQDRKRALESVIESASKLDW